MDYQFKADEWVQLPAADKVLRARLLGGEARKLSVGVPPILREIYLGLAGDWETLAAEIERSTAPPATP